MEWGRKNTHDILKFTSCLNIFLLLWCFVGVVVVLGCCSYALCVVVVVSANLLFVVLLALVVCACVCICGGVRVVLI